MGGRQGGDFVCDGDGREGVLREGGSLQVRKA